MVNNYKHSHDCINSNNKYSEIEFVSPHKVIGLGVSSNILLESFTKLKFNNNQIGEYDIEFIGIKEGESDLSVKGSFHDDCFFDIELRDKVDIKRFLLGVIRMHQEYIGNTDCIKEPDISDDTVEEIINNKLISIKTIGGRVVIINHFLKILEQKLPKIFLKDNDILFG